MKPTKGQLEIGVLVLGTLALLLLYRSYLERSLKLQADHMQAIQDETTRSMAAAAATNGHAPTGTPIPAPIQRPEMPSTPPAAPPPYWPADPDGMGGAPNA